MVEKNAYLLVVGNKQALAWILSEGRMAFPERRSRAASGLQPDDTAFLYTTRGCFGSPPRDRGRVIGEATITSSTAPLETPVTFGDRTYPVGCDLRVETLAPAREGAELAPLVERMHAFGVPEHWSVYLRRPLVPLDDHDAQLLREQLREYAASPGDVLRGYLDLSRPATGRD